MQITLVKKIFADGSPCKKCAEVEQRLKDANAWEYITHVIVADERDPSSEGMQLASQHQVDRAPFFIVETESGKIQIYTVFLRFMKEVIASIDHRNNDTEKDTAQEILKNSSDLDFL